MTDLAAFGIKNFAYGQDNMHIIVSEPSPSSAPPPAATPAPGSPNGASLFSATSTDLDSEIYAAELAVLRAVTTGLIPPPPAKNASAFLQLFYPANSINPGQAPQGGADFYATPLDLSTAKNVTLEYSVFFPVEFDWVQAGKLPGIYGGHESCSGGDDADECFSTRLMWRSGGAGELYLVSSPCLLSLGSGH